MEPSTLIERVDAVYARSGPPSWPDPHVDHEATSEEYSRVTAPERYAITMLRARAWVDVLGSLPDVDVDPVGAESAGAGFSRGVRLNSRVEGTLPLFILERDAADAGEVPTVSVSLAEPAIELERFPDCGCDACDFGSDSLLSGLDDTIVEALHRIVLVIGSTWQGTWTPNGGGVGGKPGHPDLDQVMAWGRRLSAGEAVSLPRGVRELVSGPWF